MAGPVDGIGDAQRVRGIEIRPTVGIIVDVDHAAARRDHIDMLGQGKILKAQLLCNHAHDEPHVVARPNLVDALEVMHRFLMHAHAHASRPQAASQAAARPAVGLSSLLWPKGGASCRRPAGFVMKLTYHGFSCPGTYLLPCSKDRRLRSFRAAKAPPVRPESSSVERRVGEECGSTSKSRCAPYN